MATARRNTWLLLASGAVAAAAATGVVLVFTATSSAGPSRESYLEQVADVCRVYGPQLDGITPPDVAEPANVIDAVERVLPLVRAQLRSVRALRPPEAMRGTVSRWLVLQDRRLRILESALAAGRKQDFRTMSIAYVDFALASPAVARLGRAIGIPHPPC